MKMAKAMENTITIVVELTSSDRVGHITLVNSVRTSAKKVVTFSHIPRIPDSHYPLWKKPGLAGLEPATAGFGDQCSTN